MTKTIVAIFDEIAIARQVVEDLVNADYPRSSISLITNDAHNQYSQYLEKDYVPKDDAVSAVQGAGFGAVVGALTGILAGVAALVIPGIGLAIVAGPIVAGLTGAVAGAVTGGVVGALVKTGVPEDDAPYYAECIRRGGTLISIQTSDTLRAEDIMNRYGSINIHERINVWRQAGWKGFDSDAEPVIYGDTTKVPSEIRPPTLTETITPTVTPIIANPIIVVPVVPKLEVEPEPTVKVEPYVDDVDTAVMVNVPTTDGPIPVTPNPDAMLDEPVVVVVEKELQAEYVDPAKSRSGY